MHQARLRKGLKFNAWWHIVAVRLLSFAATGNEACFWLLMFADFLCNMVTLSVHHVHNTYAIQSFTCTFPMKQIMFTASVHHVHHIYASRAINNTIPMRQKDVHSVCAPCAQQLCQSSFHQCIHLLRSKAGSQCLCAMCAIVMPVKLSTLCLL